MFFTVLERLAAVTLVAGLVTAQPREPFRVHVYASPRGEPELVEAIERATRQLAKRVGDDDDWFRYTEHPEQAEILVHVESLAISGLARRGGGSNFAILGNSFELQALVEFLGRTDVLVGRSRTSEIRAADALSGELKAHVEQNYESFEKRRILFRYWADHPEQIPHARALCDEVDQASKELGLPVATVRWSGSTLVLTTARTTSRFPFTSARLETCIPDASCRRSIVEHVKQTLSR